MSKKFVQSLVLSVAALFIAAPAAYATAGNNPAGNNGFVKINNELAPDNTPDNHPHVSCKFSVEFYNFDKGDYKASVNFALQAPTVGNGYSLKVVSGNLHPFIGEDAAGGGKDLDASEVYKLTFTGKPHDKQGYHVKVTVNAPGSKGSDKKHKVFWVKPCAETTEREHEQEQGREQAREDAHEVLGETTPDTLPVTGSPSGLIIAAASVAGILGYAGRYLSLKRRSI